MRVQIAAKWARNEPLPNQMPEFKRVSLEALGTESSGVGLRELLEELRGRSWSVPEVAIDLATLAFTMYAADMGVARSVAQDSWTRELLIDVPVSDPALWDSQAATIGGLLNYLTGDRWFLRFRSRPPAPRYNADVDPSASTTRPDVVTLFSGGLDSCVGAIDALSAGARVLCVSHAGDGFTSGVQRDVVDSLDGAFPNQVEHLRIWYTPTSLLKQWPTEKTTRGRSFLFFAVAAVAAASARKDRHAPADVLIPENGFISLNVPLDSLRLGAHSTRTTHPFVLRLWNQLLVGLGMGLTLKNPYQFKTKGEMFAECANRRVLKKILPDTMSCSSPTKARWKGLPSQHCGHCVPCIIRHAAVRKAFGSDDTQYATPLRGTLSTSKAEGRNVRAFQRALQLYTKPQVASIIVHSSGPLDSDPRYADLYLRGLNEVKSVVSKVRTHPEP